MEYALFLSVGVLLELDTPKTDLIVLSSFIVIYCLLLYNKSTTLCIGLYFYVKNQKGVSLQDKGNLLQQMLYM